MTFEERLEPAVAAVDSIRGPTGNHLGVRVQALIACANLGSSLPPPNRAQSAKCHTCGAAPDVDWHAGCCGWSGCGFEDGE